MARLLLNVLVSAIVAALVATVVSVSVTHRMLMAAAGAGSSVPASRSVVDLTAEDYGGWAIPNPAAFYVASTDRTVFAGVKDTDGSMWIAHRDHATDTTSTPFNLGSPFADDGPTDVHNNPSVIARASDDRLVVAYASHEDNRVRVRVSTNPGDASAWGSEQALNPGYGGVYTYAMLVQLAGVTDAPIYLFARSIPNLMSQTGRLAYAVSTNGGASWSSWSLLFTGASTKVPYWTIASDDDTRFDVFTTKAGDGTELYHFWFDGTDAKTYQSDGTEITATRPFVVGDMTQVYDGTGSSGTFALGAAWRDGTASVLYARLVGSDNDLYTARWRTGAWLRQEVVSTVGGHHAGNAFLPSANMKPTNPDRLLIHSKVSGTYEAFLERSEDDGATWIETQITSGSTRDQMWAMPVFHSTGKLDWLWLDIDYTSDTDYDAFTRGYGTD